MKRFIFFLLLSAAAFHLKAQQVPPPPPQMPDSSMNGQDTTDFDKEFKTVQIEAQFPGGMAAWVAFLQKNINPNTPRKQKAPPGKYTVLVSFLVDKTGKVFEVTILKDPGFGCAEDVLRIFKKTPDWTPAVQNGKNVIYRQKQQITYIVD